MKQGLFDQSPDINPDRLHEELKAALGDKYISMDTGVREHADSHDSKILVRLNDTATDADKVTVESVIQTHDPKKLSTRQQEQVARKDAYIHFKAFDFTTLRAMNPAQANPIIIDLLQDIQKLMQGTE